MQGIYSSPFTTQGLTSLKSVAVLPHTTAEPEFHPSKETSLVAQLLTHYTTSRVFCNISLYLLPINLEKTEDWNKD